MFHHVTDSPKYKKSNCYINTNQFYKFIDLNKKYISIDQLFTNYSSGSYVITFDDGLEDLYTIAYPYLSNKGIPFTAFIITDFLDQPGYISKRQLIEMDKNPLITIGSHGVTHEILTKLSLKNKIDEINNSKKILEEITGHKVQYFAYSHGQYDKEVLKISNIYKAAFSTAERPYNFFSNYNKLRLPRYNIDYKTIIKYLK